MLRNLEIGDKVVIVPFIGMNRVGKVTKVGRSFIYADVLKFADGTPLVFPESMKFNRTTFLGVGKHLMYNIAGGMYGEHERYIE